MSSCIVNYLTVRRAGILLHITSLPGVRRHGDLGTEAYHFVDFLHNSGITIWQTLPISPPHDDGSPYQCVSAHAGNPALLNLHWLVEKGWLERPALDETMLSEKELLRKCLIQAYAGFEARADAEDRSAFTQFRIEKSGWLDDYALFMALKREFSGQPWHEWPEAYKNRSPKTLSAARRQLRDTIRITEFEQFVFFQQWHQLKTYANQHGVLLFGDIPIFVSYDSADVWAQRQYFKLDAHGAMLTVAGVPPDYFSATGQRWGNPHYNWDYLERQQFDWWIERIKTQLELFDILRIDHFRGLEAAWEIPANEPTAMQGQWVKAPGESLLSRICEVFGNIPLVAEDLGVITPEVEQLRDQFGLPGMRILQFAFDGSPDNPYLPFHYPRNCVVYTGTHDNDTTLGWYQKLSEPQQRYVQAYFGCPRLRMPYTAVHAIMASVANLAVVPMQDILELDSAHRMNTPGTTEGNWQWRFHWDQLTEEHCHRLAEMVTLFGRAAHGG